MNKCWLIAITLCLWGCTTYSKPFDDRAFMAQMTPAEWRQRGVWYFDVVDNEQQSIGHIVLLLTGEDVDSDICVDSYWKSAIVLDNSLDFDFGLEIVPAYHLNGPHLSVELTASSCRVHHRFLGDATSDGAAGSFNYLFSLNGNVVGTFIATSVIE